MNSSDRLQEALDALAVATGHSLSIDDPEGLLVAYSAQGRDADPARVASILSRRVAPDILAWENLHGIADATGPVHVPANPELGMTGRWCVPIRRGRRCLGYLWILDAGTPLDAPAMTRAAAELADALGEGPVPYGLGGLIRRLLGDAPAGEVLDGLAAAAPSLLGALVQVCAVVPAVAGRQGVAPFHGAEFQRLTAALPATLRTHRTYVGSFVTATHGVVLLRHRLADTAVEELAGLDGFTVGVSDPAPFEVDAVRAAYGQALAAAELAALDPALPSPVSWSGLGPYRAFLESPASLEDALSPLDAAGASGAMLTTTLETYLDLAGDAGRTAARLHLHRTSLYYRLRRIAEVLDADLDDGLTRLHLHLALKSRRHTQRTFG